MKYIKLGNIRYRLAKATSRYCVTIVLLVIAAILHGIEIESNQDKNNVYIYTLIVGGGLCVVAQMLYERYMSTNKERRILLAGAIVLTVLFYFHLNSATSYRMILETRSFVALFIILISIMWIPSIKSKITFNQSFMVVFKGFFIAAFYALILFLGTSLIVAATNELLFSINYRVYEHSANIIFILIGPLYFLSLIPIYPGKSKKHLVTDEEVIEKGSSCPKYLDILISYIIIPITMVYTMILLIYFIRNITNGFWNDNLLEPMIVSYSMIVILVYLLSSRLNNKIVGIYRKVFPKILIPIVLFQTIASVMKIDEMGLTHGRYYVILYGIFATISGFIFSFLSVKKNGIIAILLIVFSCISILPPVDAFHVSYTSQKNRLEAVLQKNNMLKDGVITGNGNISKEDKKIIITTTRYLQSTGYSKDIDWFIKDEYGSINFSETYGFNEYEGDDEKYQHRYVRLADNVTIPIQEYDYLFQSNMYDGMQGPLEVGQLEHQGVKYSVNNDISRDNPGIVVLDQDNNEIIRFSISEIYNRYRETTEIKENITVEEATFTVENNNAKMVVIIRDVNLNGMDEGKNYSISMNILLKIK